MGNKTPLYRKHVEIGAKMVDFAGWDMPLHYGSQIEEHHQVRRDAGMFDVSHMAILDFTGEQARPFLRHLLANNVDKLRRSGKALYSCMLNEQGGVIDDLIVYYLDEHWFRVVSNAATRAKDLAWIQPRAAARGVQVRERRDLAMVAVQGPGAREKTLAVLDEKARAVARGLTPFTGAPVDEWFIACTGYTGEDGFEIMVPAAQVPAFWDALAQAGVKPIGLGARDTLRLEAGLNLYGSDMTEETSPLESGLGWTVAWDPADRDFIGRKALEAQRGTQRSKFVGLVLEGGGVLRSRQKVVVDGAAGEITSGGFSPTLGKSIALARVPARTGATCQVEIRGRLVPAKVVKPPFVRHGKSCLAP